MLCPCKYYPVNTRLFAGVTLFSREPGFWFCCLKGTVVVNKGNFKATSQYVTMMVSCISSETRKPITAILTTDPAYAQYSGNKIDTDIIPVNNNYMLLCTFLKDKFGNTNNPFTLTFAGVGSTLDISADMLDGAPRLRATIKIPTGEAIMTGDTAIGIQLKEATGIKAFRYSTVNPSVEKEVFVRKCYGEILREVAHYLNRTLVFICQTEKNLILEQYISAIGSAEIYTKEDGVKVYKKVSAASLQELKTLGLYTTTSSVDDILRNQERLLRK